MLTLQIAKSPWICIRIECVHNTGGGDVHSRYQHGELQPRESTRGKKTCESLRAREVWVNVSWEISQFSQYM